MTRIVVFVLVFFIGIVGLSLYIDHLYVERYKADLIEKNLKVLQERNDQSFEQIINSLDRISKTITTVEQRKK